MFYLKVDEEILGYALTREEVAFKADLYGIKIYEVMRTDEDIFRN